MTGAQKRIIHTYDHRLRDLVHTTGEPDLVIPFGVPFNRARMEGPPASPGRDPEVLDLDQIKLQAEVLKLCEQVRKLGAVIYLLVTLLHAFGIRLDRQRLLEGQAKAKLLQAIERVQKVLPLRGALRILHGPIADQIPPPIRSISLSRHSPLGLHSLKTP